MRRITLGIAGILCIASIAQAQDNRWTGSYIGGNVGFVSSRADGRVDPLPNVPFFGVFPNSGSLDETGFAGGVHLGRNWQLASPSWVGGIEVDWSLTDAEGSFSQNWVSIIAPGVRPGTVASMSMGTNWLATIRGRIGHKMSPTSLLYFTGGIAIADVDYRGTANNETGSYASSSSFSKTVTGYVLGGGIEWALRDRWSLRVEYLFHNLDSGRTSTSANTGPGAFPPPLGSSFTWSDMDVHLLRFGASYKF